MDQIIKNTEEICPNCGYCPHCGRGGYSGWPGYPSWPWYPQPYTSTFGPMSSSY